MTARRIVRSPDTCGGKPRFEGTRFPVEVVCRNWPVRSRSWFVAEYHHVGDRGLTADDVEAAIRWCRRPDRRLRRWIAARIASSRFGRWRAEFVARLWRRWGDG